MGVKNGLGRHNAILSPDEEIQGTKWADIATIIYIITIGVAKLSVAVFLLRIAVKRTYAWILRISMVILVLWSLAIFFFAIFTCWPVAYQWDTTIQGGTCASDSATVGAAYSFSIISIISDWLYALIPIPMLWNVHMNVQTKVSVATILSLGITASVATLVRIRYLSGIANQSDFLYTASTASVWTTVEIGLCITAASMVTLRPLLRALNIPGFSSNDNSRTTPQREWTGGGHRMAGPSISSGHEFGTRPDGIQVLTTLDQSESITVSEQGSQEFILLEGPRMTKNGSALR